MINWIIAFALIIAVLVIGWLSRFISYHTLRRLNQSSASYVSTVLQFGVTLVGLYYVMQYYEFNPGIILAAIAIVTAGVSLHAGQIIESSIAGAVLLLSGHISTGEHVTVADITGQIVNIGFSSVTVQSNSRGLVTIPSSKIVGDIIVNHTRLPAIEMSLTFVFHDTHDNALAIKVIKDVLSAQKLNEGSKVLHAWVDGSQTYAVVFKVADYQKRREISSTLSLALTYALEREHFPLGSVMFTKAI